MHVLIVESNRQDAARLQAILTSLGHEGTLAADGEEALARLEQDPSIRLVLSAWMLPKLDGLGLVRALKTGRGRPVPVVIMSVVAPALGEANALQAGAVAYLAKPVSVPGLTHLLRSLGVSPETPPALPEERSPGAGLTIILAGTLGGQALATVLVPLVGDNAPPVLIVHQGPWAASRVELGLAGDLVGQQVQLVTEAMPLKRGRVYGTSRDWAPDLDPLKGTARVGRPQPRSVFTSVLDRLFEHAGQFYGDRLRVLVLCGDSSDGVRGLLTAARSGASILAADPKHHGWSGLIQELLHTVSAVRLGRHEELARHLCLRGHESL